jgi:PAS domain S-box-containing protein
MADTGGGDAWDDGAWLNPGDRRSPFRDILEALPGAVYVTDPAGRITLFNRAAVRLLGRTPEIGSDRWCVSWRLFWPDGRPMAHDECPMARALKEDRPIAGEEAIAERPDGTRVPFMAYPTPLHDPAGRLIGAINMLVDLTDRKRAEAAAQELNGTLERRVEERTRQLSEALSELRKSERRFRFLVEGAQDHAIFTLDAKGFVADWNSGAERIKGYRRDEIVGQHFSRFYAAEDRENGLPHHALAMAARNGSFAAEGWRVRKDGSRFWASVVISRIRDEAAELVGFAKITRDMTERRAVEEQLHQAQKMEAIGQLTNGIAHDFNNVLGAIVPNLELAYARVDDQRVRKCLENALRAAEQGVTLTDQLLTLSRRKDVRTEPVDIGRVISETCAMLPRTIGPNVAVEAVLEGDPWHAVAVPASLQLAILNLAINARDAMPEGGTLTIETSNIAEGTGKLPPDLASGDYVMVSVVDTGSGMSDEVSNHALDPFFTTKEPGKGTGLGLSMVYSFAKQCGGTVTIESEIGKGATVRIYLRRAGNPPGAATEEKPEQGEILAGPPSRILVVDDDSSVRTAISASVRALGHEAIETASGQEALELLGWDRRFDLLIIDYAMPVVHGTELAGEARRRVPGVPVLFVTGDGDAVWESDVGQAPVLKKPFRQADLAKALRDLLTDEARSPTTYA